MLKKKTAPAPTFAERVAATSATRFAALSVFEQAAADLDAARDESLALATEISEQIGDLRDLLIAAEEEASAASSSAAQIRSLIGGAA